MKKILSILCLLIIFISMPSYADVSTLTLEGAYDLLEENNLELSILERKIELNEKKLKEALWDADDISISNSLSDEKKLEKAYDKEYDPVEQEKLLEESKLALEDRLEALKVEISTHMRSIRLNQSSMDLLNRELEELNREKENIQLKLDLGLEIPLNLEKIENEINAKENSIASNERQIKEGYYQLNQILGLPVEETYEIRENFLKNGDVVEMDYETLMENMEILIANDSDYIHAKNDFDLLKLKEEIILEYIGDDNNDYDDNEEALADEEISFFNQSLATDFNFYQSINGLKENFNNMKIAKNNYLLSNKIFDVEEIKYDLDQSTIGNRMASYNAMYSDYMAYQRAIRDYELALENFNYTYNVNEVEMEMETEIDTDTENQE